jgi:hypothetical protein
VFLCGAVGAPGAGALVREITESAGCACVLESAGEPARASAVAAVP